MRQLLNPDGQIGLGRHTAPVYQPHLKAELAEQPDGEQP